MLGLLCKFLQQRLKAWDLRGAVNISPCPPPPPRCQVLLLACATVPVGLSSESSLHSYKISIVFPPANTLKVLFKASVVFTNLYPRSSPQIPLSVKPNTYHPVPTTASPTKSIMFARLFSLLLEMCYFPPWTFHRPSRATRLHLGLIREGKWLTFLCLGFPFC